MLAITFTNKAANEMKSRIEELIGPAANGMWVMTFHSMCARILRKYGHLLGYTNVFSIYDADDSKALLKKIIKEHGYEDYLDPKRVLSFISGQKCNGTNPKSFFAATKLDQSMKQCYSLYEDALYGNNALDFDDLLLKTVDLFLNFREVLDYYKNEFKYIMVDEYQDTNKVQFQIISLLSETHGNLFVVGDDDQSIYSFRGADIDNILGFQDVYPDATIIKLEENYRSTSNILNTANAVISKNKHRANKVLHTKKTTGKKVYYQEAENAIEEANLIINDIICCKYNYSDIAILYRTNAQSRQFEEACIRNNLPYKIIGGINFYQRKEIKDLIAYLKIIANPSDSLSIKRIINVPKRNIGQTSIAKVEVHAKENNLSFYQGLLDSHNIPSLSKKTISAIKEFMDMIELQRYQMIKTGLIDLSGDSAYMIVDYIDFILNKLGYLESLEKTVDEEIFVSKKENIDELINKIAEFESTYSGTFKLNALLENIALVSTADVDTEVDKITMMTLHASKGLEFKKVYLVGLEEGIFPSSRSLAGNVHELEEERRLCYVGITRARESLFLSSALSRMINGRYQYSKHSRFIDEMPKNYVLKKFY